MSCEYEFIPGPEPCFIQTVNEVLGRASWEHPDYPSEGLVFRTRDVDAFNTSLNGATLTINMYGSDGVTRTLLNTSNIYTINVFPFIEYDVIITEDGIETFNQTYSTGTFIIGSPEELRLVVSNTVSTIVSDINAANLGVGIVTGAVDAVHSTITSLPLYLLTTTLTISGTSGLSDSIDPPDQYRTGPDGAFVYVGTSQEREITTPGITITVNELRKFNLITCVWDAYDPLNP